VLKFVQKKHKACQLTFLHLGGGKYSVALNRIPGRYLHNFPMLQSGRKIYVAVGHVTSSINTCHIWSKKPICKLHFQVPEEEKNVLS
jgi:hypothetical protein